MTTPEKIKWLTIRRLEDCMVLLSRCENRGTDEVLLELYQRIYRIADSMREMDGAEALRFYEDAMGVNLQTALKHHGINI